MTTEAMGSSRGKREKGDNHHNFVSGPYGHKEVIVWLSTALVRTCSNYESKFISCTVSKVTMSVCLHGGANSP